MFYPYNNLILLLCLGLQIDGNQQFFDVGEQTSVVCSSDLDVTLIEWIYNYNVVVQTSAVEQLSLVFNPVNDSMHGRQYTCRVTSPYGIQEETIQVTAESKLLVLSAVHVHASKGVEYQSLQPCYELHSQGCCE